MLEQTQICGVVLPVRIAQRARIVAAMNGKSRSSLMRELLLDYLARYDNALPQAEDAPPPVACQREQSASV